MVSRLETRTRVRVRVRASGSSSALEELEEIGDGHLPHSLWNAWSGPGHDQAGGFIDQAGFLRGRMLIILGLV